MMKQKSGFSVSFSVMLAALIAVQGASAFAVGPAENIVLKLIQPLGIIIAIISFWLSYLNYKKFGGILGNTYKYIMFMLAVATISFTMHAFVENGLLPDNFVTKAMYESLFVLEVILIGISARVAAKSFEDLFKSYKKQ